MILIKILVFVSIFLGVIGQTLIKSGLLKIGKIRFELKNAFRIFLNIFTKPIVDLGMILYFVSFIIWLSAISKLDLSYLYPLSSSSYILVVLISKFILKEKVSKLRWISVLIITFGVILVSSS